MKKKWIFLILIAFIAVGLFASGYCDCDCLWAAIRDPDTSFKDVNYLAKALIDYNCL